MSATELTDEAAATQGDVRAAVRLAQQVATTMPLPGGGRTQQRWDDLSAVAAGDLSAARITEAHLDALAILAESGSAPADSPGVWGVYAAEGPGVRVDATEGDGGWELSGTKPWCSGAQVLDRALVTAHVEGGRRLFAIDLRSETVTHGGPDWVSRGLANVTSGSITLDRTPARPVGENGWYLSRPGFAWGGIGVAACWFGGVLGIARRVWASGRAREPDQVARMLLGRIDRHVEASRLALQEAARLVDAGAADGDAGVLLAERVRGTVAAAVDAVVEAAGHSLGPAPLATDEDHARRVADLQIYVRQHHAERDTARLGQLLLATSWAPW
jgi:alkylation response protein AidB-like acyl-CoA dehydrogenase